MPFKSSFTKDDSPEQPTNEDLTDNARSRIFHVVDDVFRDKDISVAFKQSKQMEVFSEFHEVPFNSPKEKFNFFMGQTTEIVFAYLEHLFAVTLDSRHHASGEWLTEGVAKINDVLESEGILWDIEQDDKGYFRLRPISSEKMKESVDNVRELALDSEWEDSLEPYLKAVEMYSNGEFTYRIPEKLNLSIENVVTKICIDEGWLEDEDKSSGKYIAELKHRGFFENNNIMEKELNLLLNSLDLMRKKVEGDRKRHDDMDRTYSTLLLHQVSAYIYFLIKMYEKNY